MTEGKIEIDDKVVNDLLPRDRGIAMVFQNYALYPHMTVEKNIAFGLKNIKTPQEEINKKVDWAIDVLGLEEYRKRKPKNLSGGQRQRVALGRAIVRNQKVFLMDEPLSNLDAKLRVSMRNEITKLHRELGATTIYVTHDQTEAMTLGTRIVVMKDGVVQQIDTPYNLYNKPKNMFVAGFIGSPQMNLLDAICKVKDGEAYLEVGNNKINLPKEKSEKLIKGNYADKKIVMGIRPEDIYDRKSLESDVDKVMLHAKVSDMEMLGAETFLYFDINGNSITARVDPKTTIKTGDTAEIALDIHKIHFFDKETELRIV